MAYTVGYCDECKTLFFEPTREIKQRKLLGSLYDYTAFNCPVCKKETEFNMVGDLSDY